MNENMIFYVIPLNKIKECRGYPKIVYIGSEKSFSMFCLVTKLAYKNEITAFALPDSLCLINTPDSIVKASSHSADNKSAKIENDRMVVED
jgi:hypothetical protein